MSIQGWQETLISAQVDGSPLTNTAATPTSILPAAAKYTFPANVFSIGKVIRVTGFCRVSNVATTPGTLTLDFRLGGTVAFNGGAMQMSTTSHTNLPLKFEMVMTCRAIGSSANFMGQGIAQSQVLSISTSDSTATHSTLLMPNSAPAVGSNVDSTTALVADVFATFSVSTATTSITLHQYILESLN